MEKQELTNESQQKVPTIFHSSLPAVQRIQPKLSCSQETALEGSRATVQQFEQTQSTMVSAWLATTGNLIGAAVMPVLAAHRPRTTVLKSTS